MFSLDDLRLGFGNLFERSSQMNGTSLPAVLVQPRNGAVQSVIYLKDSRPVFESLKCLPVPDRKHLASNVHKLPRGYIQQDNSRLRQFTQTGDRHPSLNFPAECPQVLRQRFGDRLCPAAWDRPSDCMAEDPEKDRERC